MLTEAQLRQIVRENIAEAYIIREKKILSEWLTAVMAAIPKVAKYAPVVYSAVKAFTGGKSDSATPDNMSKVMNMLDMGMGGGPKHGTVAAMPAPAGADPSFASRMTTHFNEYGQMASAARGMANNVFGNPASSQQIQQAMGAMGPDLGRVGDKGIQAVFGKNNPQQMIDMSVAINKGGLGDAALLYGAMKGLGTDDKVVKDVIARRSSDLRKLSVEFAQFITQHPAEKDTDLISWLRGDGMYDEAKLISMATGAKSGGLFGNFLSD